jgi:hypothetical protein
MTFDEFENKFKRNVRFDKYWYHGLCYLTIGFGLFMLFALLTNSFIKFSGNRTFHYFMFSFLTLLGIYGLFVLRKKYNLTIVENSLTKEKNMELLQFAYSTLTNSTAQISDNYVHFIYRKSWWRLPYEIHLFADNNLIAINVDGQDNYDGGFIDFGASKRTQNKILKMLTDQASR